ncbi:MAG: YjfI family protein [Arenicella sp.]|nr:YjfI family protein [Arenicella sp.]
MTKKSSAEYQREYRKRLRKQGLVKKEIWVLPENGKSLASIERELRKPTELSMALEIGTGGTDMNTTRVNDKPSHRWTTESLFGALKERPAFNNDSCSIEIIDGIDSIIVVSMHNYGDLPIFVTAGGDQILAEAVLFSLDEVKDTAKFNEYVLRTHKYLPLSTISLETDITHGDYYYMFGALSASSSVNQVVLEIETLAENTIQATEAFQMFLKQ